MSEQTDFNTFVDADDDQADGLAVASPPPTYLDQHARWECPRCGNLSEAVYRCDDWSCGVDFATTKARPVTRRELIERDRALQRQQENANP